MQHKRVYTFGRGRGSNPASKANLGKGRSSRRWYIYRSTGSGWVRLKLGPNHYTPADRVARGLQDTTGVEHIVAGLLPSWPVQP